MHLVSRHQSPRGHTAQTSDDRQGMPHIIISESPPSAPSIIMTRDSDTRFYTSSSQDSVEVVLPTKGTGERHWKCRVSLPDAATECAGTFKSVAHAGGAQAIGNEGGQGLNTLANVM